MPKAKKSDSICIICVRFCPPTDTWTNKTSVLCFHSFSVASTGIRESFFFFFNNSFSFHTQNTKSTENLKFIWASTRSIIWIWILNITHTNAHQIWLQWYHRSATLFNINDDSQHNTPMTDLCNNKHRLAGPFFEDICLHIFWWLNPNK